MTRMVEAVAEAGVETLLDARVERVLVGSGGVEGVVVAEGDGSASRCIGWVACCIESRARGACLRRMHQPWCPAACRAGAVVMATGGFGASQEMLERFAHHAAGLSTSNGPQATGDGMLVAFDGGAALVHMDQVWK